MLAGTPVIANARIPAHDVLAAPVASVTGEQTLTNFPPLATHHIKLVASYCSMGWNGSLNTALIRTPYIQPS
ncbi:DUF433 domain-containing protein [Brucella sp. NBRC 12950]|uniref:DUF433 domain-containing protein n=1 Tax=Brucella sp. NBRC 12950 TaxID=2994518 RepID=UPI003319DA54